MGCGVRRGVAIHRASTPAVKTASGAASCFELFLVPRARRALGDSRAAARGPHPCARPVYMPAPGATRPAGRTDAKARARTPACASGPPRADRIHERERERERERREPGRAYDAAHDRESAHKKQRRAPRPAGRASAPTRILSLQGSTTSMIRSSARAPSAESSSRRPTKAPKSPSSASRRTGN